MSWRSLLILMTAFGWLAPALAQRPKDDEEFVADKPTIGDPLPELTVYDPDGKAVTTSSLRGQPVVLVFGCLT